jgi:hypothetical protein
MTTVKVAVLMCGGGVQTSMGRWRAVPGVELKGGGLGATPSSQWRGRRNFGINVILGSKIGFMSCGWMKKPRKASRRKPVGEVDENKPTECFVGGIRNLFVLFK